jgi:DNA-binding transcriptional ArsR family regulator
VVRLTETEYRYKAHPLIREQIVRFIARENRPLKVGDICDAVKVPPTIIAFHLRDLGRAGLLQKTKVEKGTYQFALSTEAYRLIGGAW